MIEPFDIVIYHGNCYDGFGSAWVARQHSPAAKFIAAQYGDPPPDVTGKRVLICDFSYKRSVLTSIWRDAAHLMLLDHHKSAQAEIDGLGMDMSERWGGHAIPGLDITFDLERSGIGITWDTLMPRLPRPRLVDHIEDRDLWRFWIPGTREIHALLSSEPFDFEVWDRFSQRLEQDHEQVERDGGGVMRYIENTCRKLAARARRVKLCHQVSMDVWAVNAPPEMLSETAEILKSREPALPILAWSWDGERGNFYCSLRSRDDGPDVSEIAARFGGGGHRHAAGFRCSFIDLLQPTHDAILVTQ